MILLEGHAGAVRALAYSPDGSQLLSGAEDGKALLWNFRTPDRSTTLFESRSKDEPNPLETICWTTDDSIFAFAWSGDLVRIRGKSGRRKIRAGSRGIGLRSIDEFREGNVTVLLTCTWDGKLIRRDMESLEILEVPTVTGFVKAVATSADRTIALVATQDGSVRRYSPSGWQQSRFLTDGSGVQCIACDPMVGVFALANQGSSISLFRTGPPVPELIQKVSHPPVVLCLAFTPDGRRLVSGGADGTVRIWDVQRCEQLHVFEWHRKWVTCLAMSLDGLTVATGSEDSTIAVWDMPD